MRTLTTLFRRGGALLAAALLSACTTLAPSPQRPTEIPADLLPSRPTAASVTADEDPTLAEYNRYLAELAARNDAAGRTGTETPQDRTTA